MSTFTHPKQLMNRTLFFTLWLTLFLFSPVSQAKMPLLLDVKTLDTLLQDTPSNLVLVDMRTPEAYQKDHIPHAINLPMVQLHRSINEVDGFILSPLGFRSLVENLGIKKTDHLVFYSGSEPFDSARAFWAFEFYGHASASILDGGYPAWKRQGLTRETQKMTRPKSNYPIELQSELFSSKFNTLLATKTDSTLIIDARSKEEYLGEKSSGQRFGRIPNAENLEWKKFLKQHKHQNHNLSFSTFIQQEEIKALLNQLPAKKRTILYCNGGREAAIVYFALRLINKPVSVYDGSWNEWSADKKLAVEQESSAAVDENEDENEDEKRTFE